MYFRVGMNLGRVGVCWSGSWQVADYPVLDAARELESLGYGALWSSARRNPGLSPLRAPARLDGAGYGGQRHRQHLGRCSRGRRSHGCRARGTVPGPLLARPCRASHAPIVQNYARPYSQMVAYLDALDALVVPVPPERRVLAALGPRMLQLASERAAGQDPYFVPVEHTMRARGILGPGTLLVLG